MFIEEYLFVDALYMTMITVTTVGFGEVNPLNDDGKIFTSVLSFVSLGFFAYSISVITTYFVEGRLNDVLNGYSNKIKRKMDRHIIVVGFGRNGQQVTEELTAHNEPFVVIDRNRDTVLSYQGKPFKSIEGDATDEAVLLRAGIEKAKAIITTLPNDADNLFVALTARSNNHSLIIVSRASSESVEKKLKVAGVNNVVMPEKVGGAHMAKLIAKPDIVEFLDHLSVRGEDPTNLIEIECGEIAEGLSGNTISEFGFRKKSGANIVGFKTPDGKYILNPSPDTKVIVNSKFFVLGTTQQVEIMRRIIKEGK